MNPNIYRVATLVAAAGFAATLLLHIITAVTGALVPRIVMGVLIWLIFPLWCLTIYALARQLALGLKPPPLPLRGRWQTWFEPVVLARISPFVAVPYSIVVNLLYGDGQPIDDAAPVGFQQ